MPPATVETSGGLDPQRWEWRAKPAREEMEGAGAKTHLVVAKDKLDGKFTTEGAKKYKCFSARGLVNYLTTIKEPNNLVFYEEICDKRPRRVAFDLELKLSDDRHRIAAERLWPDDFEAVAKDPELFLSRIVLDPDHGVLAKLNGLTTTRAAVATQDCHALDSCGEGKLSFHIATPLVLETSEDQENFNQWVQNHISHLGPLLDLGVYRPTLNMRLPFCRKGPKKGAPASSRFLRPVSNVGAIQFAKTLDEERPENATAEVWTALLYHHMWSVVEPRAEWLMSLEVPVQPDGGRNKRKRVDNTKTQTTAGDPDSAEEDEAPEWMPEAMQLVAHHLGVEESTLLLARITEKIDGFEVGFRGAADRSYFTVGPSGVVQMRTLGDEVLAKQLVKQAIGAHRADTWQTWFAVGAALCAVSSRLLDVWIDFSAQWSKYTGPEECAKLWPDFKKKHSIGTLMKFAREDNPKKFKEIMANAQIHDIGIVQSLAREHLKAARGSAAPPPRSGSDVSGSGRTPATPAADEHDETASDDFLMEDDADGGGGEEPTSPPLLAEEEKFPIVMPEYSKAAVQYVVRTSFPLQHTTVITDKALPPITSTVIQQKPPTEDDEETTPGQEKTQKALVPKFKQIFTSDAVICRNIGRVHDPPALINFELTWFGEEDKAVNFGDRLPAELALSCGAKKCCAVKKFSVPMLEGVEHYVRVKEPFEKEHFKVLNPLSYGFVDPGETFLVTPEGMAKMYTNMPNIRMGHGAKSAGSTPFIRAWITDPGIRTYHKVDMLPPPLEAPPTIFNTWSGFAAERMERGSGNVGPWLKFIKVAVEETCQDYFHTFFAHTLQKPGENPGVCVSLVGDMGAGKGSAVEGCLGSIIGDKYYMYTNNPEDLFSKHSEMRNGKILGNLDDFNPGLLKKFGEEFKSQITAKKNMVEKKFMAQTCIQNFLRIIVSTNNIDFCKIDEQDRRMAMVQFTDALVGNHEYFEILHQYLADPGNLRAIYDYYMGYDITKINLRKDRPKNQLYTDAKVCNADPVLHFLAWRVQVWWRPGEHTQHLARVPCVDMVNNGPNASNKSGDVVQSIQSTAIWHELPSVIQSQRSGTSPKQTTTKKGKKAAVPPSPPPPPPPPQAAAAAAAEPPHDRGVEKEAAWATAKWEEPNTVTYDLYAGEFWKREGYLAQGAKPMNKQEFGCFLGSSKVAKHKKQSGFQICPDKSSNKRSVYKFDNKLLIPFLREIGIIPAPASGALAAPACGEGGSDAKDAVDVTE